MNGAHEGRRGACVSTWWRAWLGVGLLVFVAGGTARAATTELPLDGAWEFRADGAADAWLAGTVPGCVHTDLLRLQLIPDPFVGTHETRLQELERQTWRYRRTFTVTPDLLRRRRLDLECDGLDTLATVLVNDRVVGRADNMYRRWIFPAGDVLRPGSNTVEIVFRSPLQELASLTSFRLGALQAANDTLGGSPFFRKAPYQFGWDWAPRYATCGIWKSIRLVATDDPTIEGVTVRQQHAAPTPADGGTGRAVTVTFAVTLRAPLACTTAVEVAVAGVTTRVDVVAAEGLSTHAATCRVVNPALWWPAGLGAQPLYPATVTAASAGGTAPRWQRRLGFRTARLETQPDADGIGFRFVVNDVPVFCKGANWIPCDSFPTRVTPARYRRLLEDAVAQNMNMLRVWGGGIYEHDVFYELCDELGLMVWQDFMFSCSLYPADPDFLANVEAEAREQVRRLQSHASLVLWCGNNECETALRRWFQKESTQWAAYTALFHDLLPRVCAEVDPDRPYWPSSPHSIRADDPGAFHDGDAHIWSVWHQGEPFEAYQAIRPRFVSEFGFQSFPAYETVRYYAGEHPNLTAPAVLAHQKNGGGNTRILTQMADRFRMPSGFRATVVLSQIQQAVAMQTAVEHWRRQAPYCAGTLYWQLNDCWPVASWSAIDYFGRRKALFYFARRFNEPFLVSTTGGKGVEPITVCVTTDTALPGTGSVAWTLRSYTGGVVAAGTAGWTNLAPGTLIAATVPAADYLSDPGTNAGALWTPFNTYLAVRATHGGRVAETTHHFARFREIDLPRPHLRLRVAPADGGAAVTVSSDVFAKWVWLEAEDAAADGRFADNFFDLEPGSSRTVRYTGPQPARFTAHSLTDTYAEPGSGVTP